MLIVRVQYPLSNYTSLQLLQTFLNLNSYLKSESSCPIDQMRVIYITELQKAAKFLNIPNNSFPTTIHLITLSKLNFAFVLPALLKLHYVPLARLTHLKITLPSQQKNTSKLTPHFKSFSSF